MDAFYKACILVLFINWLILFVIVRRQSKQIDRLIPMAKNWVAILKARDAMIKNGTWDGDK